MPAPMLFERLGQVDQTGKRISNLKCTPYLALKGTLKAGELANDAGGFVAVVGFQHGADREAKRKSWTV